MVRLMERMYAPITAAAVFTLAGCSIGSVYIDREYRSGTPAIASDSIHQTLFFIGDAGEPAVEEKTLRLLTSHASVNAEKNTVVFLGDNLYPQGLPEPEHPDRIEMERRLNAQIAVGKQSGAVTFFVPGNHDWAYQQANGLETVRRQGSYIAAQQVRNMSMRPADGNPGPEVIDFQSTLRLVLIDTQWWLHTHAKPFYPGDTSEAETKGRFLDSLAQVIRSAEGRMVLIAGHHPLRTHGEHGGFFDWKDHLFPLRKLVSWLWVPLPGIGSLYPLSRLWGISDQDLSGKGNAAFRAAMESLLVHASSVVYAAGHDHTLQILKGERRHLYIVSGNGVEHHDEALTAGDDTILASRSKGFMRLDVGFGGRMRLSVIAAEGENGSEIFSMDLH